MNDAGLPPLKEVNNTAQTKACNPHETLTPRSRAFLKETVNSYFDKVCILATEDVEETASSDVKKSHVEGGQSQV